VAPATRPTGSSLKTPPNSGQSGASTDPGAVQAADRFASVAWQGRLEPLPQELSDQSREFASATTHKPQPATLPDASVVGASGTAADTE
jgi:hypothetical protein